MLSVHRLIRILQVSLACVCQSRTVSVVGIGLQMLRLLLTAGSTVTWLITFFSIYGIPRAVLGQGLAIVRVLHLSRLLQLLST